MSEYYNHAETAIQALQAARDAIALKKSIEFEKMKEKLDQQRNQALIMYPFIRDQIAKMKPDAAGKKTMEAQLNWYKHTFNIQDK